MNLNNQSDELDDQFRPIFFQGQKRKDVPTDDDSKRVKLNEQENIIMLKSKPSIKQPKFVRKFRSRSLPIICYNQSVPQIKLKPQVPPLPPINLQSLKEIDLHEILKNPQLRHDILFDPQLQFRPNLDGERGKRKKSIIDKYWYEIHRECSQFFNRDSSSPPIKITRLPILFSTLRDVLLSLLPNKDRHQVNEIMDLDLLVQQLNHGSFDFIQMSKWLGDVFKSHCAPMRDQWVVEMIGKFQDAYTYNSVEHLINGLRSIFQILEAMKLDVANHQIRILRPVLVETAVDFERDYFNTLINHNKININDSLAWFYKNYKKSNDNDTNENYNESYEDCENGDDKYSSVVLKPILLKSITDLLSCRQMAAEFPSTLAFDHTRLVLLRADVRQLVCVQLCIVLYKQLVTNKKKSVSLLSPANLAKVQQEILAIVTDDNGNIKWTKNINSIVLQLVKNVMKNEQGDLIVMTDLPSDMIEFSYNWLIKHIQPSSSVYGLMELKIFKDLQQEIMQTIDEETTMVTKAGDNSELKSIASRISTLGKFHWQVFGGYYTEYLKSKQA